MAKVDLKSLDKKLNQVVLLTTELKDLEQSMMMKQGIINDLIQDIMITDLKYPKDAKFTLGEVMFKIREMSGSTPLIVSP